MGAPVTAHHRYSVANSTAPERRLSNAAFSLGRRPRRPVGGSQPVPHVSPSNNLERLRNCLRTSSLSSQFAWRGQSFLRFSLHLASTSATTRDRLGDLAPGLAPLPQPIRTTASVTTSRPVDNQLHQMDVVLLSNHRPRLSATWFRMASSRDNSQLFY